jgi:putative tricarboxylic transport membrane protein
MSDLKTDPSTGRAGTLTVACLFVAAGVITLYDTTTYSDLDAKVFPRAAAIVLILSSIVVIIVSALRPVHEPGLGRDAWWRRVLLVSCMLTACFVMPYVGFLPAGVIAFGGAMVAAMHERWSLQTALGYSGAGIVIMVGFYALFRFALNVPLP